MRRLSSRTARRRGHVICRSAAAAGVILASTIVVPAQSARAKELKNFVTDLFGRQGLQLNDPAEGIENVNISQATVSSFGALNGSISTSLGPSSLSSAV